MALEPVPIYDNLDAIYPASTLQHQGERWSFLTNQFSNRFGSRPSYIVRAPGRVNLIGEHIDYSLFGVLPTAIERDILMAISPSTRTDGSVQLQNLDSKYRPAVLVPQRNSGAEAWELPIDRTKLSWESYVKAGYLGVLNKFFAEPISAPRSVDILVSGTIPPGSGISSSAALVVASTLSFLLVNDKLAEMTKRSVVEMAMENERRVGVNSGGMDQAASVISNEGCALYITFHPNLEAEPIPIPSSLSPRTNPVFVIANSLVVSDKAVSAKTQYNLRVLETLVAARILAISLGIHFDASKKITLKEVLDRWISIPEGSVTDPESMKDGLVKILEELECLQPTEKIQEEGWEMEAIIQACQLDETAFNDLFLSWNEVEASRFQLYKRAKHVYSEALRVLSFRNSCFEEKQGDPTGLMYILGSLMDESQTSCAELFDCSCPEVDELTELARSSGAYGSRLTGAGWGGCTVSLVAESNVAEFVSKLRSEYGPYKNMLGPDLNKAIFATKPGSGACVYSVPT